MNIKSATTAVANAIANNPIKSGMIAAALVLFLTSNNPANNPTNASVMITNGQQTSGGSGVVLQSGTSESTVLTNSHVCGVVANGGLVVSNGAIHEVNSYKRSEIHDLCLITVSGDLGISTKVASRAPRNFEDALVMGHPHLLPTTPTHGYFSGTRIISILIGFTPCAADDDSLECLILGGIPIIKEYESQFVTATIMPGSSGSGVYNSNNDLTGLVFAGSGQLGYAWTVPYASLLNFLNVEASTLTATKVGAFSLKSTGKSESFEDQLEKVRKVCETADGTRVKSVCDLIKEDLVWNR